MNNVLITGSFDLTHPGHLYFMEQASKYGDLYVGIGSDASIEQLKGRPTIWKQEERLYMVKSIKWVKGAWINNGMGNFDFFKDPHAKLMDILIVNSDQDFPEKRLWCNRLSMDYIVLPREPHPGFPAHSSTEQREFINQRKW